MEVTGGQREVQKMPRMIVGLVAATVVAATVALAQGTTPDGRPIDPAGVQGKTPDGRPIDPAGIQGKTPDGGPIDPEGTKGKPKG